MATYRPLKKIVIPILALIIGLGTAIIFIPTKMDAHWNEWKSKTMNWEEHSYTLTSMYVRDGVQASEESGLWTDELSHLTFSARVSDDTTFAFDIYIEDEHLFIFSGEEWRQGTTNDRFINEITPLNDPFEWMRDMLAEAETIEKYNEGNHITYVATFTEFDELDFRGYSLEKQKNTTLTLSVEDDNKFSMQFHAEPIRPDYLGPFDGYPKEINYNMQFERTNEHVTILPSEAYTSKGLDE